MSLLPRDAVGTIKEHLDNAQNRYAYLLDHDDATAKTWKKTIAEADVEKLRRHVEALSSGVFVEQFGVAYLLAVLCRVDSEVANRAAEWLADQWESGDTLGEWIYQWREELAAGTGMTLPAVDDDQYVLDIS